MPLEPFPWPRLQCPPLPRPDKATLLRHRQLLLQAVTNCKPEELAAITDQVTRHEAAERAA